MRLNNGAQYTFSDETKVGAPEDFHISIVLAFGFPAKTQKRVPEAARLPFDEYVRRNHW